DHRDLRSFPTRRSSDLPAARERIDDPVRTRPRGGILASMWRPLLLLACAAAACATGDYFQIRIVDEQTGRGVPLVELRTTNKISCWTDSNGIVAWNEPDLMQSSVYFSVQSPGYTFPGGGKTLKAVRRGSVE